MAREGTMEHPGCLAKIPKTDQENVGCLDQWVILAPLVHKENLAAVRLEIILDPVDLLANQVS